MKNWNGECSHLESICVRRWHSPSGSWTQQSRWCASCSMTRTWGPRGKWERQDDEHRRCHWWLPIRRPHRNHLFYKLCRPRSRWNKRQRKPISVQEYPASGYNSQFTLIRWWSLLLLLAPNCRSIALESMQRLAQVQWVPRPVMGEPMQTVWLVHAPLSPPRAHRWWPVLVLLAQLASHWSDSILGSLWCSEIR